jgi:hypothetical protein
MRNFQRPWMSIAIVLASGVMGASPLRASFIYSYAQQTISALTVIGAGITNGSSSGTSTSASAAADGSGISTNNPLDTLQAYVGALPPSPQNNFTKYSTSGGGPQAGDFARGDAVISGQNNLFSTGAAFSVVAEAVASGTISQSTGASGAQISGSFMSTDSSVTVSFNYANDILVAGSGAGSAQSHFGSTISIKDQHGHENVSGPLIVNNNLAFPPSGPEAITSGSVSVLLSLGGLTSGDVFSVSVNDQAMASATLPVTMTPEPASAGLLVAGAGFLLLWLRRSRLCKG